jgi:hypothetical protein
MRNLIENYVKSITKNDILKLALDNNFDINDTDIDILYHYVKNNWQDFLYGNPEPIIMDLKNKIGIEKAKIITDLFYYYKAKYQEFL